MERKNGDCIFLLFALLLVSFYPLFYHLFDDAPYLFVFCYWPVGRLLVQEFWTNQGPLRCIYFLGSTQKPAKPSLTIDMLTKTTCDGDNRSPLVNLGVACMWLLSHCIMCVCVAGSWEHPPARAVSTRRDGPQCRLW